MINFREFGLEEYQRVPALILPLGVTPGQGFLSLIPLLLHLFYRVKVKCLVLLSSRVSLKVYLGRIYLGLDVCRAVPRVWRSRGNS